MCDVGTCAVSQHIDLRKVCVRVEPRVAFEVSSVHRMVAHPLECRDAVVVGGGKAVLRSQSVSHGDYDCAHRLRQLESKVVYIRLGRREEAKATAVEIDD
jgi:hypothetical protein